MRSPAPGLMTSGDASWWCAERTELHLACFCRCATRPTPQLSRSITGSYRPCFLGSWLIEPPRPLDPSFACDRLRVTPIGCRRRVEPVRVDMRRSIALFQKSTRQHRTGNRLSERVQGTHSRRLRQRFAGGGKNEKKTGEKTYSGHQNWISILLLFGKMIGKIPFFCRGPFFLLFFGTGSRG